jgi:hypothetical protein
MRHAYVMKDTGNKEKPPREKRNLFMTRCQYAEHIEGHCLSELAGGRGHLVFNGFNGKIQEFGYFAVFEAIFLYQFEDKLAAGWQFADGGLYATNHFCGYHQSFGVKIYALELHLVLFRLQQRFLL